MASSHSSHREQMCFARGQRHPAPHEPVSLFGNATMAKRKSRSDRKVKRKAPRRVRQDVLIEFQRVRLFEALGIVEVSRHALASKLVTLDEESVIDALRAVYRII